MKWAARRPEAGHAVDDIDGKIEAIDLIAHGDLQRSIDVAVFFIAAHMEVPVILYKQYASLWIGHG